MAQINLYIIIALSIAVIALGGGWYVSSRISTAKINTLSQRNAVLTSAVAANEKTIAQMIADATVLAAANQQLTGRIIAAEMEFFDEWSAINALDLEADAGDVTALEGRINGEFQRSISGLKAASGG